jgi:hypothetical protein
VPEPRRLSTGRAPTPDDSSYDSRTTNGSLRRSVIVVPSGRFAILARAAIASEYRRR